MFIGVSIPEYILLAIQHLVVNFHARRKFLVIRRGKGSSRWGLGLKEPSEMPAPASLEQPIFFGTTVELLHRLKEIEQIYGEMDLLMVMKSGTDWIDFH